MVSEWPRLGIFLISVTFVGFDACTALAIAQGTVVLPVEDQQRAPIRLPVSTFGILSRG